MATFSNFRKFSQVQNAVFNKVSSRLLVENPREKRKKRQMEDNKPKAFNFGSVRGRREFYRAGSLSKAREGLSTGFADEIIEDAYKMAEAAIPEAVDVVDDRLGRHAFEVRRKWPVRTQVSQTLLDLSAYLEGDTLRAEFLSGAPYDPFIKAKKLGGRNPTKVLIQRPMNKLRDQIMVELADRLDEVRK